MLFFALVKPLAAAPCAAYPAGTWKLDRASAIDFEHSWLLVLKQKNTAALDCILAADFKDTSMKGLLRPKWQVLHELPLRNDQYQQTLTELEAEVFGEAAVVHGVDIVSDQQGKEVMRIRFTDTLGFTNGRWLAVAAQETTEQSPH
jgi:hypothetical protein